MTKKRTLRTDQAAGATNPIESDEARATRILRDQLARQLDDLRGLDFPTASATALANAPRADGASPEQVAMDRERVRLSRQIFTPEASRLDDATRDRIERAARNVTTNLIAPLAREDRALLVQEVIRIDRRDSAEDLERRDDGFVAALYLTALTREARIRAV